MYSQSKAVRNAEKVKLRQKKDYEKARTKEIKRRFGIQTDETKKQMKEAHQRAIIYNKESQNKTFFLKRWLKKMKLKK